MSSDEVSSDEQYWTVDARDDVDYDDYFTEDKFYLDDDEDEKGTFEQQSNIVEVSAGRMDMISAFVQNPNLNSSNINTSTGQGYFMEAIAAKRMDIVHKFIEYQVDLNACDNNNWTPLHHAVYGNNIECVCLLLSYGVDVRIKSKYQKETPLILAYKLKCDKIIKLLLNYYYEFSNVNVTNFKLDYKYQVQHYCEDIVLLILAMDNGYVEPFKLIWQRINCYKMFRLHTRFVQKYLYNSIFAPANKTDCLYLTLEMADLGCMLSRCNFFLHKAFLSKNFDQTRRMDLLFMLLSTGVNINQWDTGEIYKICGFNKEVEALIYAGIVDWHQFISHNFYNKLLYSILSCTFDTNTYYESCEMLKHMDIDNPNDFIPWLKYFSFPTDVKCQLSVRVSRNKELLLNSLREISEFPSLLELSRLAVQNLIKQTHVITKPYQLHDAVKNLCLPQYLKDIVLFKRPIYK